MPLAALHAWTPPLQLVLLALPAAAAGIALLRRAGPRDSSKRGARVLRGRAARRAMRRRGRARQAGVALAGVRIEEREETRHFKLIGTTGTGKSSAIAALLAAALARGDRAVISDADGLYAARFWRRERGDVILNPFDPRSVQWDLFAEIGRPWDIEQLVSGLIALGEDAAAREWRGYARTFLSALLRRCCEAGRTEAGELWRLLTVAPTEELRPLLAGTPAQPFLDAENARMFGSIRSVAASAAAAFEHVQAQRARPFSIRHWLRSGHGALFMPYQATQVAALRTIIAAWMRLAIYEAMSHPGEERRLWFVVDELDSLGAIDGLKDALARLRKFGGRCVLGFQSIAQVSATYGHGEAQTIVENCANTLILRCSGSEHGGTAQFAARLIGEREVIRRQVARARDRVGLWPARDARRSHSVSEQQVTESAVLAAEIEQLPDLSGYLKTAAAAHWLRVSFPAQR